MPINVSCEYECDQCAAKVEGVVGTLPAGWVDYDDASVLMRIPAGAKRRYVFDTEDCKTEFLAALDPPQN